MEWKELEQTEYVKEWKSDGGDSLYVKDNPALLSSPKMSKRYKVYMKRPHEGPIGRTFAYDSFKEEEEAVRYAVETILGENYDGD